MGVRWDLIGFLNPQYPVPAGERPHGQFIGELAHSINADVRPAVFMDVPRIKRHASHAANEILGQRGFTRAWLALEQNFHGVTLGPPLGDDPVNMPGNPPGWTAKGIRGVRDVIAIEKIRN